MNAAMKHINEQLVELSKLTDDEDIRHQRGILQGMCIAYFRVGSITMKQWEQVCEEKGGPA